MRAVGRIVKITVVLDEKLVEEVMKLANGRTAREAIEVALQRFIPSRSVAFMQKFQRITVDMLDNDRFRGMRGPMTSGR